jgi:ParB family chromosome partitioning protein
MARELAQDLGDLLGPGDEGSPPSYEGAEACAGAPPDSKDMEALRSKVMQLGTAGADSAVSRERARSLRSVPIDRLRPNRFQPRRHFDETALRELANSIKAHGLLQPILVRPLDHEPEGYEVVAGERRWRAARLAGLNEVQVVVRAVPDRAALVLALIENVDRQDLSPIEIAEGYRQLIDEFGYSQDELSRLVNKSRSQVANTLRLLNLPVEVRGLVQHGMLSAGHARALLGADTPEDLAKIVMSKGLSVRQTEALARRREARGRFLSANFQSEPSLLAALERELSEMLDLGVSLSAGPQGGEVTIRYRELADVERLLRRLKGARPDHTDSDRRRIVTSVPNPAHEAAPMRTGGRNVSAYGPPSDLASQTELAARFMRAEAEA